MLQCSRPVLLFGDQPGIVYRGIKVQGGIYFLVVEVKDTIYCFNSACGSERMTGISLGRYKGWGSAKQTYHSCAFHKVVVFSCGAMRIYTTDHVWGELCGFQRPLHG